MLINLTKTATRHCIVHVHEAKKTASSSCWKKEPIRTSEKLVLTKK